MKFTKTPLTIGVMRSFLVAGVLVLACGISSTNADESKHRYAENDIRGTWTYSGWVEATLLIPFPGEVTQSTPPSSIVSPGDKVTLKGTLVGLFNFDGRGGIESFEDLFKAGGVEPISPPFPLPFLPPAPEQGHGTYSVNPDGTVELKTLIINPDDDSVAGELDYACVLNRSPRQLECIIARFKTFLVDPAGFEAPIVGLVTLRPQR
jgi:hypothetical protein